MQRVRQPVGRHGRARGAQRLRRDLAAVQRHARAGTRSRSGRGRGRGRAPRDRAAPPARRRGFARGPVARGFAPSRQPTGSALAAMIWSSTDWSGIVGGSSVGSSRMRVEGPLDERTLDHRAVARGDRGDVEALHAVDVAAVLRRGRPSRATGSPRRARTAPSRSPRTRGRDRRHPAADRAAASRTCRPPSTRRSSGRTARGWSASRTPAVATPCSVRSPMSKDSPSMIQRQRCERELEAVRVALDHRPVAHQLRVRARGHHLVEVAGVVDVVVREEDPPHVLRLDEREHVLQPLLAVRRRAGVDDHRLGRRGSPSSSGTRRAAARVRAAPGGSPRCRRATFVGGTCTVGASGANVVMGGSLPPGTRCAGPCPRHHGRFSRFGQRDAEGRRRAGRAAWPRVRGCHPRTVRASRSRLPHELPVRRRRRRAAAAAAHGQVVALRARRARGVGRGDGLRRRAAGARRAPRGGRARGLRLRRRRPERADDGVRRRSSPAEHGWSVPPARIFPVADVLTGISAALDVVRRARERGGRARPRPTRRSSRSSS